jgi:hypothetical protein
MDMARRLGLMAVLSKENMSTAKKRETAHTNGMMAQVLLVLGAITR